VKSPLRFKVKFLTRLLIDENVPNNVREWLKGNGFDIVNVSETILKRAKDYTVAEYAAKNDMTILTLDRFRSPLSRT
jgi:predicted nuclease of predicted toxin-antitoxin system